MAFVYSRGNILLRSKNGEKFRLVAGSVANVPSWAEETPYFQALVKEGKIIMTQDKKDAEIDQEITKAKEKAKAKTKALTDK